MAFTSIGPGAANTIMGVATAYVDSTAVLLITGAVIYLVPEEYRLYAVCGFAVLYLVGTLWAAFSLKALFKRIPFGDTFAEFKKDRDLLEAFE